LACKALRLARPCPGPTAPSAPPRPAPPRPAPPRPAPPRQSLPFGGVKMSGFGRFGGVEGLRALTVPKAVAEDALPFMKTTIPGPWLPPVGPVAQPFAVALTTMFYGPCIAVKLRGLGALLRCLAAPGGGSAKRKSA
jgi:hypothetical protein